MGEGTKARFDGLDVTAMVAFLQTIIGRRIVNIYNGETGETYVFKLDGQKEFLLIESGVRFHTMQSFESNGMPSPFCSKLRKHLRGLRLELVRQIGTDRLVLLQFGAGPSKHFIILELYSKGNLILTDGNYLIMALLRSHEYEGSVKVKVGQVYPVTYASTATTETKDEEGQEGFLDLKVDKIRALLTEQIANVAKKPKKKKTTVTLKTFLLQPSLKVFEFGPGLIEHCIMHASLEPNKPLEGADLSDEAWKTLQVSLREQGTLYIEQLQTGQHLPGYILYKAQNEEIIQELKNASVSTGLQHLDKILLSFQPHLLLQHENTPRIQYENFGDAVADFFLHSDIQKRIQKIHSSETAVKNKLEKVKQGQTDRLVQLEIDQKILLDQAEAVKNNAVIVDQALQVINSALDNGVDWDQLEELMGMEQSKGNPVASTIRKLALDQDCMTLGLPVDPYDDESVKLDVIVLLKESAHANASRLFGQYRASKEKSQKTIEASAKAIKAAEESAQRQLANAGNTTRQVFQKRKVAWYEKFHWFVTTDNYLVLAGRDAHQNETLVKRYLREGDAYLHADIHGASSCILRAKRRRLPDGSTEVVPLSEQALGEAGNFTVCRSSAWSSRMVTSAWWVESHQVSKTAPSGEYLTVGSFMVRGKKNFLPPTPLEMGLAVLFRLGDDDSISRHQKERRDFALIQLEAEGHIESSSDPAQTSQADSTTKSSKSIEVIPPESEHEDTEQNSNSGGTEGEASTGPKEQDAKVVDGLIVQTTESSPVLSTAGQLGLNETKKKKGLSVRDRKLIKKYGSLEEAERVSAERAVETGKRKPNDSIKPPSQKAEIQPKGKRGQKGKAKKIAKKYADQDDEDRELAMLALKGGEKQKRDKRTKSTEEVSDAQREVASATAAVLVKDSMEAVVKLPEQVQEILSDIVKTSGDADSPEVMWNKFDAETIEQLLTLEPIEAQVAAANRLLSLKRTTRVDNFSASLSGIIRTIQKYGYEHLNTDSAGEPIAKRKTKVQKHAEEQEWQNTLRQEGLTGEELDENAVDDTIELSKLTGKPIAEDLLLHAVPVCAPYQTLSQYAYRVKLTPGNVKRGKASKQCADMFLKMDGGRSAGNDPAQRNRELIKQLADNDWVQTICADVKISSPGAAGGKNSKKQKAGAKKSKTKKK